jgi:cytochrome c peroxidase
MWDGAVNHLDMQALAPISHPAEMDEDLGKVIEKLRSKSLYRKLSYQAFGDSLMTGEYLLKAFAQFQLTLVSANARYDAVQQGEMSFTEQEQSGYKLFLQHCNSCHTEPLFSSYEFADNGLPVDTTLNDFGRWMITQQEPDRLQFKIPSLRNLSYSYPYMHDGRFRTLGQVLDHYNSGVVHRETLAETLANPVVLSNIDKADLIAFLLTLNDQEFVFHPDHQYPRNIFAESEGF